MRRVSALTLVFVACAAAGCGQAKSSVTGSASTLIDLNRALAAMAMMNRPCPAEVSELTNFPTLRGKTLPMSPPGKKLVIDPVTRTVAFVDQ